MASSGHSLSTGVRRSARFRGIIALVLVVGSALGVLVTLDLWDQTVAPEMISLPSNMILTISFIVAALRAFAIARRGGHTDRSATADHLIAIAGLGVVFAMVYSALTAAGTDGFLILVLYAVGLSAALETLLVLNWRVRSIDGHPLAAHRGLN